MSRLFTKKYPNLLARLCALSVQQRQQGADEACWVWTSTMRGRSGNYPRINVRIDGAHRQIGAHRAALVAAELAANDGDWELFGMLYDFYSLAGLEADHAVCNDPRCVHHKHLEWKTQDEHLALTLTRRAARNQKGQTP